MQLCFDEDFQGKTSVDGIVFAMAAAVGQRSPHQIVTGEHRWRPGAYGVAAWSTRLETETNCASFAPGITLLSFLGWRTGQEAFGLYFCVSGVETKSCDL